MLTESQQYEVRRLKRKTSTKQIARMIGASHEDVRQFLVSIRERQYYQKENDPTPEEIEAAKAMLRAKHMQALKLSQYRPDYTPGIREITWKK